MLVDTQLRPTPYLHVKRVDDVYRAFNVRTGASCPCSFRSLRALRALSRLPFGARDSSPLIDCGAELSGLIDCGVLQPPSTPADHPGAATRVCIATTVRDTGPSLLSFIRYHLAVGFAHVFVFFDDPHDPLYETVATTPCVSAVRADDRLQRRHQRSVLYTQMAPQLQDEVMARQILNVEVALDLASTQGMNWLLHIDSDELFCADGPVGDYFAAIPPDVGQVSFLNLEALPEDREVQDCFRDVTLFKEHPFFCDDGEVTNWLRAYERRWHYLGYSNGKSAVRVVRGALPGSVHNFILPDRWLATRVLFPAVLHYINCGFDAFLRKYRTLGRFSDSYWGRSPRHPFHLAARDVVLSGDDNAVTAFYDRNVLCSDDGELESMVKSGLVCRNRFAANLLSAR